MKKLRVLVLVHEDLVPPDDLRKVEDTSELKTEFHVIRELKRMGHTVRVLGVGYELYPIRRTVKRYDPHVVFNLLEEFRDEATFDQHIVAYLELLGARYTGCGPRGLVLARDKALSKKILTYHRIPTPPFVAIARRRKARRPRGADFPLIVKSLNEEASMGIAKTSVVDSDEKLAERVRFIHERIGTDALVEQFIPGRELYLGVFGNRRLRVLPPWELFFRHAPEGAPLINTAKAKWDKSYQDKWGIDHGPAKKLPADVASRLVRLSKRIYKRLGLSGYARLDFRLTDDGKVFFLEANPNPDIAADEELAMAARADGLKYPELIQKVINLGMRR